MIPDISEFSFGYAVTSELLQDYPITLVGAPTFPTQYQEGKKGGYDVALPRQGAALFLQFKRSDWMKRATAAQATAVGIPHYRMHLRPLRHSQQHNLLLGLEEDDEEEVYYATPRFHTFEELNRFYLAREVVERTSFIPPSWIGPLPDEADHHVAISVDDSRRRFCSHDERKMRCMPSRRVVEERILRAARERAHELDETFFRALGDKLVSRYVETIAGRELGERERARELRDERPAAAYSREVAQMLYGCELLVATS